MRPEKEAIAEELKSAFDGSDFSIVFNHKGMDVQTTSELRKRLREKDSRAVVVKNTFLRRAAESLGLGEPLTAQTGPTTLVTGGDVTQIAKLLKTFRKEFKMPEVKGGTLGTDGLSAADIDAMADIPPRDILLAILLGTMAAPMTQLAGVMSQKLCSLMYVLNAAVDKKSEG